MERFEHNSHRFRVEIQHDADNPAPWENEDGHGPVSEWKRHAFGRGTRPPKRPGEMILLWENGGYRTYDFQEAVKIAKHDGWNAPPYGEGTRGQRAHRAAMADFKRMRDWCNGRWHYVGVIVHLLDDMGDDMGESESLWGIESDAGEYLDEVARELADTIIHNVSRQLRRA